MTFMKFFRRPWCGVLILGLMSGCAMSSSSKSYVLRAGASAGEKLFHQGLLAAQEQQWKAAALAFQEAAVLVPGHMASHLNRAMALERAGKAKQALHIYRDYSRKHPEDRVALQYWLRALQAGSEHKAAIAAVQQAPRDVQQHSDIRNQLAVHWLLSGNTKRAAAVLREVLLKSHKNVQARVILAWLSAEAKQWAKAQTLLSSAQRLAPKNAVLIASQASLAYRQGSIRRALQLFEQALKLDAGLVWAHENIAFIALLNRDYPRAKKHLTTALKGGATNCRTQAAAGFAEEGLQQGKAALEHLTRAYEDCPEEHMWLQGMARVTLDLLREPKQALQYYEMYLKFEPRGANSAEVRQKIQMLESLVAQQAQEAAEVDSAPLESAAQAAQT